MRRIIDSLSPKGVAFTPAPRQSMDLLLDGVANSKQNVFHNVTEIANLRNPATCLPEILPDLERELGITPDTSKAITDRRHILKNEKYKKRKLSTIAKLQESLDAARFGLTVTQNESPEVDPLLIIDETQYYLVTGNQFIVSPLYPQAGQICARAFNGSDSLSGRQCAGYYTSYRETPIKYEATIYWGLVFFVGGSVTRQNGKITRIETVRIPKHRKEELHRIILRIKPLGVWAAMVVEYV